MDSSLHSLIGRVAGADASTGAGLDWGLLLLVTAGCLGAWGLCYGVSMLVVPVKSRRTARMNRGALLARLRLDETLAGILAAAMLVGLTLSIDAVLRLGEVLVMSTSGVIALAATPMLVGIIEGVHLPRAQDRAGSVPTGGVAASAHEPRSSTRMAA